MPTELTYEETDHVGIPAVNGAAVGWGMELALRADIRFASDKARFGELFVKRGLVSRVVPHEQLLAAMLQLAAKIARNHRSPCSD